MPRTKWTMTRSRSGSTGDSSSACALQGPTSTLPPSMWSGSKQSIGRPVALCALRPRARCSGSTSACSGWPQEQYSKASNSRVQRGISPPTFSMTPASRIPCLGSTVCWTALPSTRVKSSIIAWVLKGILRHGDVIEGLVLAECFCSAPICYKPFKPLPLVLSVVNQLGGTHMIQFELPVERFETRIQRRPAGTRGLFEPRESTEQGASLAAPTPPKNSGAARRMEEA